MYLLRRVGVTHSLILVTNCSSIIKLIFTENMDKFTGGVLYG